MVYWVCERVKTTLNRSNINRLYQYQINYNSKKQPKLQLMKQG
jgi:hypothetical protein